MKGVGEGRGVYSVYGLENGDFRYCAKIETRGMVGEYSLNI